VEQPRGATHYRVSSYFQRLRAFFREMAFLLSSKLARAEADGIELSEDAFQELADFALQNLERGSFIDFQKPGRAARGRWAGSRCPVET
jgi:hypothetical protein